MTMHPQVDRPLRVLVACEFSGTVRNAFAARGHDAWSCDLLPSDDRSNKHIVGDERDLLGDGWDLLMVAHPPCTRLCNSGVRWLKGLPALVPTDIVDGRVARVHMMAPGPARWKERSRFYSGIANAMADQWGNT